MTAADKAIMEEWAAQQERHEAARKAQVGHPAARLAATSWWPKIQPGRSPAQSFALNAVVL
jgi:hypothetical protein